MRYITKLEMENEELKNQLRAVRASAVSLEQYLSLPKFHVDTTVQVSDIRLRMQDIFSATCGV